MIRPFLLLLFTSLSFSICAQTTEYNVSKNTRKFINEVSKVIRKNALYSDSLNWAEIDTEIRLLPFNEHDSANHALLIKFFTDKLRRAGDKHSFFMTQRVASNIRSRPKSRQPEGQYAGDGIGVIKVPYCLTLDNNKDRGFANAIRNEIKKIDTGHQVIGWVVDLRQNFGGNMWPMLAGLNALIDDGTVGYFVSPALKKERPWVSKNGQLNFPMRKVDDYKVKNRNTRIAVLIDSITASSAEMTAISFIGLPNVQVFGQPSAGLTTANNTYRLSDGTELNLATTYVADRTKKPYLNKIIPDVIINSHSGPGADAVIEASKKWLLQKDAK